MCSLRLLFFVFFSFFVFERKKERNKYMRKFLFDYGGNYDDPDADADETTMILSDYDNIFHGIKGRESHEISDFLPRSLSLAWINDMWSPFNEESRHQKFFVWRGKLKKKNTFLLDYLYNEAKLQRIFFIFILCFSFSFVVFVV